ncbi:hypothetical protein SK128_008238 [Halocaridina rubra]|uniref:Uncharacterized protein n=1 Tax=Halocaridina rubra TaxID=373956 RepID=A0AAN8WA51_HALRR
MERELRARKRGQQTVLRELLDAMDKQLLLQQKSVQAQSAFQEQQKQQLNAICQTSDEVLSLLQNWAIQNSRIADSDRLKNTDGEQSETLDPQNHNDEPPDWDILPLKAPHLPTGDWVAFENSEGVLADMAVEPIPVATVPDPASMKPTVDSVYIFPETDRRPGMVYAIPKSSKDSTETNMSTVPIFLSCSPQSNLTSEDIENEKRAEGSRDSPNPNLTPWCTVATIKASSRRGRG